MDKKTITVAIPEGYSVIQRTWPETPAGGKLIVWWEKGNAPDTHFKCEGDSSLGIFCEGLGDTLNEALTSLFDWFEIIDEEERTYQLLVQAETEGVFPTGVVLPSGYSVIRRGPSNTEAEGKTIVWWEKGPETNRSFVCEGISEEGHRCEGTGKTLNDALNDLYIWFDVKAMTSQWDNVKTFRKMGIGV